MEEQPETIRQDIAFETDSPYRRTPVLGCAG
jgi:hypothetical protein